MRFLRLLTAVMVSLSSAGSFALAPVIDAFDLVDRIEAQDVVVLDIRDQSSAFEAGHIPTARHIPYAAFRGPDNNPGEVLPIEQIAALLGAVGLRTTDAVVIVSDGIATTDFGAAARVYWTLKSVGFDTLSILNGGFRGYQKDGFEVTSGPHQVSKTELSLTFNPQWYANTAAVRAALDADAARIIDARPAAFYDGASWHEAAGRPGAITTAELISFERFFDPGTPLLKDLADIQGIVTDFAFDGTEVITYCNTGHLAATNWFVLSELAQLSDVKLYPESIVEWSNASAPMMNVPSPFQVAMLKTKGWLDRLMQPGDTPTVN